MKGHKEKKQEACQGGTLPADFRELEMAAEPMHRILREKYTPHHRIIVDCEGVRVVSDEIFQPLA